MGEPSLPKQTTPTWEIELLISGVAVFAMVQLPGVLDDAIFRLRPRFDANWGVPLSMLYIYAKTAAVILAATFIIHLLLRARWIALVGLMSVHPRGIDWSRLRIGPIAREVEESRLVSLDAAVERADNSATTVFATGVLLGSLLIVVAILVVALVGLVAALGVPADSNLLPMLIGAFLLPFLLAQLADRRFGARLPEGSRRRRLVRGVLKTYSRGGSTYARRIYLPVLASVVIAVDGATIDPADYSVSRPGGEVTFDTPPPNGDPVTAGYLFDCEVRFESDDAFEGILRDFQIGGFADITLIEVRPC